MMRQRQFAYPDRRLRLAESCYLICHCVDVTLRESGLPAALFGKSLDNKAAINPTLTKTIVWQLAELSVQPEQIKLPGVGHYGPYAQDCGGHESDIDRAARCRRHRKIAGLSRRAA